MSNSLTKALKFIGAAVVIGLIVMGVRNVAGPQYALMWAAGGGLVLLVFLFELASDAATEDSV